MSSTCSCSHWWHAPIYLSLSLILALISISSPPPTTPTTTTISPTTTISTSLKTALHHHGFTSTATLLQLSPELFLSTPTTPITIFAIHDNAVSNLSSPSWALKLLFQFHTLPFKLTLQNLSLKPYNSCLPTSLANKHLTLTKIIPLNHSIEINHIPISHPDLFLDHHFSIHGVLGPFTPLDPTQIHSGLDFIHSPPCNFLNRNPNPRPELWIRVIRVLSSNGFVSFAIGLNSVMEGIIQEYPDLGRVTVFAPREFGYVGGSDPFLNRVVRYHLVPKRCNLSDLVSLQGKARLVTLLKGEELEVSSGVVNGSRVLGINGVSVDSPDAFESENFVVHVISRHFDFDDSPNT